MICIRDDVTHKRANIYLLEIEIIYIIVEFPSFHTFSSAFKDVSFNIKSKQSDLHAVSPQ